MYLFARTGDDRWDVVDQTTRPGPDDAFLARVSASPPLAAVPWAVVICLEPGAVELSELMAHWGMVPGSSPSPDRLMREFLALARRKRPAGGGRWITPTSGTAVVAENRLLAEWEAGPRPWWRFWG
jgi:hypothetical protein